jgi:hypothetical protein
MTEQICWGTTEKLIPIVQALECPTESLMMLERVPITFLSDDERQKGICLWKYNKDKNFEAWEHGRIFHNDFELQWEKQDVAFVVVYIGESKALPMPDTKPLSDFETHDESYYLWGEKMTADSLKRIDQPVTTNLFLELQIPRLLRYPVSNRNEKFRVKLSVRCYLNSETGTLEFYRFRHLEEV